MTPKALASGAVVIALFVARSASAQTAQADSPGWLKDRRYTEGIGIRTGDLEVHPGLAGEVGYDSNYLIRTDRTQCNHPPPPAGDGATTLPTGALIRCDNGPPGAPVIPSLEFRITPSLSLSTLGPQRREEDSSAAPLPTVTFRASVNATWRAFVGLSSDSVGSNDVSQQTEGLPSIGAGASVNILPGRPVGGSVFVGYARQILPNQTTADPNLSFDRDDITVGAELALQPGSGTLDWHFGYQYRTTLFERSTALGFDNGTHQIFTRGRWRFRPRTALLYDASLGFNSYNNPNQAALQGLVGSTPVRTRIGMNGLITDRLAALLLVGWAAALYDTAPLPQQAQYDSVIGQAELTWFLAHGPGEATPSPLGLALSAISLGYARDYQGSYLGNFYGSDRGYLRFNYFFGGRALMSLEGGIGAVEYPDMYWLPPAVVAPQLRHKAFTDWRADATLFSEYRFSDTMGVNVTLRYTANFSNQHDMPDQSPGNGTGVFDMGWNRFEAFLGMRWFM
jgi:hypothetical protein